MSVKLREPSTLLCERSLAAALEMVECASVIVVGDRAALVARMLTEVKDGRLKVHVDSDREPDEWELF